MMSLSFFILLGKNLVCRRFERYRDFCNEIQGCNGNDFMSNSGTGLTCLKDYMPSLRMYDSKYFLKQTYLLLEGNFHILSTLHQFKTNLNRLATLE